MGGNLFSGCQAPIDQAGINDKMLPSAGMGKGIRANNPTNGAQQTPTAQQETMSTSRRKCPLLACFFPSTNT